MLTQNGATTETGHLYKAVKVRLTPIEWLICAVACLGFVFDIYESLMLPLIVRPAITSLGQLKAGTASFNLWVGLLFYIPNLVGGMFGLLGGYLADQFGRRRILFWSILIYGFSACVASYATSLSQLLILRCTTMIGISVEFVAAITWLAEIFPSAKRRELILACAQAFQSVGGLLVAGAYYLAVTFAERFPIIRGGHQAWRYTLLSGMAPALLLLLVRPFLPESPLWRKKNAEGNLKGPAFTELFRPKLRRTTITSTLLFACTFALAYGALQHTIRMIPGLAEVQRLAPRQIEQAASGVQVFQELGALTGRILFAVLALRIVSQRRRFRVLLVPCLFAFAWVYFYAATRSLVFVQIGIFLGTMLFNGLHSFWGNYLPRMYPTHLRATGESFAANIGGRAIGVSAALATTTLSNVMPGANPSASLAHSAGTIAVLVLITALWASSALPEPAGDRLPD
jgi:MFS family permease